MDRAGYPCIGTLHVWNKVWTRALDDRFVNDCTVPRSRIRENSERVLTEFSRIRLRELRRDL